LSEAESIGSGLDHRRMRWVYVFVLVLAAGVRLVGLGHELRAGSGPMIDEVNNFVEPTLKMWVRHSPDPTVCSGYPGFFNYLIFVPVGLGRRFAGHEGAYLAARGFIAAVSVLNVILISVLVRRLVGAGAAVFAASLFALSRGEIREAHQISPDVVVTGLMFVMLLLLTSQKARRWTALTAGATVGVAIAVKYTGLLLFPGLAVGLLVTRARWRDMGLTLAAALASFALAAPYAVLAALEGGGPFGMGLLHPLAAYYGGGPSENRFTATGSFGVGQVTAWLELSLGWVASGLAVVGLFLHRPTRCILPTTSLALAAAAALGAANYIYPRHGLVLGGAVTILAACGLASLVRLAPRRGLALTLALVALALPAWTAARLVRGYVEGAPAEKAARWLNAHAEPKASVLTSWAVLDVDHDRFEVLRVPSLQSMPRGAIETFPLILTSTNAEVDRIANTAEVLQTFAPHVVLLRPRHALEWRQLPPPTTVTASEHAETAQAAWDGDRKTVWIGVDRESSIEARWQQPVAADALQIDAGKEGLWPRDLRIEVLALDSTWSAPEVLPLRPSRREDQRRGSRPGQLFLLDPCQTIRGIRITRVGGGTRWGLAEIRLLAAEYR